MNLLDSLLTKAGKPFASRFIAGDTMEDAFRVAEGLNAQGLEAIINFLGEEVEDRRQVYKNSWIYENLIREIHRRKLKARVSIKPSQLGLKIDQDFYRRQLAYVARDAFIRCVPLEIDIETKDDAVATICETIFLSGYYPGIDLRQAVAMNFSFSDDLLRELTLAGIPVRLCKGAYDSEYSEKEICQRFLKATIYLAEHNTKFDIATHDTVFYYFAEALKKKFGNPIGFQFLLGLRKKWWEKLASKGEKVAIYVPFGRNWLPYAKRRWKYIVKKIPSMICDAF